MRNTFELNIEKLLETSKGFEIFKNLVEMRMIDERTKIDSGYRITRYMTLYNFLLETNDMRTLRFFFENGVDKNYYYYLDIYERYERSSTLEYCVMNNNFELLKFLIEEGCETNGLIKFMIKNKKMIDKLDYILDNIDIVYDDVLCSIVLDNYLIYKKLKKKYLGSVVYMDIMKCCIENYSLEILKHFLHEYGFDNKNMDYVKKIIKEKYINPEMKKINRREIVFEKHIDDKTRGEYLLNFFSKYSGEEKILKKMRK